MVIHGQTDISKPEISYAYDAGGGVFTEISEKASVIIIQDFKMVKSVISVSGPSMTPALSFKDRHDCKSGGINYANILTNFEQELQKLLFNAGIKTTSTTSTATQRVTEGKRSVKLYSDESLFNSYDSEYTVYFANATPKIIATQVTTETEVTPLQTPTRTSTSTHRVPVTNPVTKLTTSTTTTIKITTTTTILPNTANPVTSKSTTIKQTTTELITSTRKITTTIVTSTPKIVVTKNEPNVTSQPHQVTKLVWSQAYTKLLESFDENWSDLFKVAARKATFCAAGPLTSNFLIENGSLEITKLLSKTQACLRNDDRITELYRFRSRTTPESILDSSIQLIIRYNTTKFNEAKSVNSTFYLTLGFPKTMKLEQTATMEVSRKISISLQKSNTTLDASEKATVKYTLINLKSEHEFLNITKMIINIRIEKQRNYPENDYIVLKIPLNNVENLYKAKLSVIRNIFLLTARKKRFADMVAGAAMGILGDRIFEKIGNLFEEENQEQTNQKIVSLTEHLKKYETSSLNYNERINEQIVEIHNEHLNDNKVLFELICSEARAQSEITSSYLRLSLSESLNQIDLLATAINDNTLRSDHPMRRNMILICTKMNALVKNVKKICQDILKDMNLSTISTITYDKTSNKFFIYVSTEMPLFKFLQNTTITSYHFLRNIKYAPETATTRVTKIKSENFSIIKSVDLPHELIYHQVKFDAISQMYIIRGDENTSIMDERMIECTNMLFINKTCPIESYRSQTKCLTQKFNTITKHQFVHFASVEPLEVSSLGSTYHGVLYRTNSEADKTSKIFSRYSKSPVVIKCGNSKFNLGLDKRIPEVKIELKTLTTQPHTFDELDLLSIEQNRQADEFNNNFLNLSRELNDLNNDATLQLGNKEIMNIKDLKFLILGLTISFSMTITFIIVKKFWTKIKNFWRQRYRTPPQPAPRAYNNIRLSNRNINRQNITTNN